MTCGSMPTFPELSPGQIVWADLTGAQGKEQSGRRPVLIVSSHDYLQLVDTLAHAIPVSTKDRGWPTHVRLSALPQPSWALVEQMRTIARSRLLGTIGYATSEEMTEICFWLGRFTL